MATLPEFMRAVEIRTPGGPEALVPAKRPVPQPGAGEILVTVATDPGWTTVFSIIGGVVVETGGVVAHAVMISREYGLPCVANLTRACERIPDGARVTVDGSTGRVVIHEPGPEADPQR